MRDTDSADHPEAIGEAKAKARSKEVNGYCAPLFLSHYYLADGHSSCTISATATFVRFRGQCYAVTCGHVKAAASARPEWTAKLRAGPAFLNLSNWSSTGLTPTLREIGDGKQVDISLCALPEHWLDFMARDKPKKPIDLDHYREPRWDRMTYGLAIGFPDREKSDDGHHVRSPMVEVVAEFASAMGPDALTFTMQSQLNEPTPYKLSGMSGGPIFALDDKGAPLPIGIIFEGYPSGLENDASPGQQILNERDVLIRGHLICPEIFARWLQDAGL